MRALDTNFALKNRDTILDAYRSDVNLNSSIAAQDYANSVMAECMAAYYE